MLTRRTFLSLPAAIAAAEPAEKPNIVVVLCDDLGYGDIACYNDESRIRTPHIDRLASDGVRFTDAHSPSAVCTPTRYGLMTGRYAWRTRLTHGVFHGTSPALIEDGRETLTSLLKRSGYRTGCFGKWHLGLGTREPADYSRELRPSPLDYGFDEFFGIPASLDMPPYLYIDGRRAVEQPTSTISDSGASPRGPFWRGGAIAPGFRMDEVLPKITERAVRFVRESLQPFFAYVPFTAPHTPWVPAAAWRGKSKAGQYGDFVAQVDASTGQLIETISRRGVARDTLFIFTSDNGAPWSEPDIQASGGHRANRPWRGQKSDIQEAGHRVPFVALWPRHIRAGSLSSQTLCLTDLFATFAAVTGRTLGRDEAEDSYNMLPALLGKANRPIRHAIVSHSGQGLFSIRSGSWKLVLGRGSGGFTKPDRIEPGPGEPAGELYNLAGDPHEDRNLYQQHPEKVEELSALLEKYRRQGYSRPTA